MDSVYEKKLIDEEAIVVGRWNKIQKMVHIVTNAQDQTQQEKQVYQVCISQAHQRRDVQNDLEITKQETESKRRAFQYIGIHKSPG